MNQTTPLKANMKAFAIRNIHRDFDRGSFTLDGNNHNKGRLLSQTSERHSFRIAAQAHSTKAAALIVKLLNPMVEFT
jgi:hypothetical protein